MSICNKRSGLFAPLGFLFVDHSSLFDQLGLWNNNQTSLFVKRSSLFDQLGIWNNNQTSLEVPVCNKRSSLFATLGFCD